MAFYSSRVDDNGNELERRLTGRSQMSTGSSNAPRLLSASSRSSDVRSERIRYINPAAFIESTDCSDSSINDCESNFEPDETPGNIVPPLDIQSNEGPNSQRYYTFSYRKHCEPATVVDPQVAYDTWLSAKRKVKSDEAARRKKVEEKKKETEAERKRLAELEYEKWLKKKEASQQNQSNKPIHSQTHFSNNGKNQPKATPKTSSTQQYLNECQAKARHEAWERKKRVEEEKKRVQKQLEQDRKRKEEEQRRKKAEAAWEKWNSTAASKPKPVPLNQGFFTLRGTVSSIYVNPNEWQT